MVGSECYYRGDIIKLDICVNEVEYEERSYVT